MHVKQQRGTRTHLAAGGLSPRTPLSVRRRHVRQQLHQHLPIRKGTSLSPPDSSSSGAIRSTTPTTLGLRTNPPGPPSGGTSATTATTRPRVLAQYRSRDAGSVLGGSEGPYWMAYGFFRYDFQRTRRTEAPSTRRSKRPDSDKPEGVNRVALGFATSTTPTPWSSARKGDMRHLQRVFICPATSGNRKTVSSRPQAGGRLMSRRLETTCSPVVGRSAGASASIASGTAPKSAFWILPHRRGVENTGWSTCSPASRHAVGATESTSSSWRRNCKAKCLIYRWKP